MHDFWKHTLPYVKQIANGGWGGRLFQLKKNTEFINIINVEPYLNSTY